MSSLNESQKRAVSSGLIDIHQRLGELEAAIARAERASPFDGTVNDLSPTERRVIQDYFSHLRSTMLALARENGIAINPHRTTLRWTLQTGLAFVNVAIGELSADRLRGYGTIDDEGAEQVQAIQNGVRRVQERVAAYVRQESGKDFAARLARLQHSIPEISGVLKMLDRTISRWELVEFRPMFDALVRRMESPQFEIAFFGRVSSGKSSLLNHIVKADVLPVGVTPVTAVPTRLSRGVGPSVVVSFAELPPRAIDSEQLREYASEAGNPGNSKHVTNIDVRLPCEELKPGVVLVDTPGVGSLARSGSIETLHYLPRCDLGVVLVDAASTLNEVDLMLLRNLRRRRCW